MSDLLARGRELLAAQPYSRLFGLELEDLWPGKATLRVDLDGRHQKQYGLVHGGVICCAAESVLHLAGFSVLGCETDLMEIKLDHLRPAVGDRLVAHAATVHVARHQAVCRCDVFVCNGRGEWLCATASGTIVMLPSPVWSRVGDGASADRLSPIDDPIAQPAVPLPLQSV